MARGPSVALMAPAVVWTCHADVRLTKLERELGLREKIVGVEPLTFPACDGIHPVGAVCASVQVCDASVTHGDAKRTHREHTHTTQARPVSARLARAEDTVHVAYRCTLAVCGGGVWGAPPGGCV